MISESKSLVIKKDENGELVVVDAPEATVLDEDEYVEHIEKIIERDYFPDLSKWRDQSEYLEAKRKRDYSKMITISQKYTKSKIFGMFIIDTFRVIIIHNVSDSFATLETPNFNATPMIAPTQKRTKVDDDDEEDITKNLSLGQFLNKYTGEDNSSYSSLVEKQWTENTKRQFWEKHYDKQNQLMLGSDRSAGVITWPSKVKNQLMYVPDGIKSSIRTEKKVIEKDNTRISPEVLMKAYDKKSKKSDTVGSNVTSHQQVMLGIKKQEDNKPIDLDSLVGGDESPNSSPKIGGYGFVTTPQIDPNSGNESPIVTWGEIEGTPLLLSPNSTPLLYDDSGPRFKMPEPRKRELVHLELTKKKPEKEKKSRGSETPRIGNRTPIQSKEGRRMAAKIMKSRYGDSFDSQLRASYNSPIVRRQGGTSTPSLTPKQTPTLTPKK